MLILTIAVAIWVFVSNAMMSHLELRIKSLELESELYKYAKQISEENNKDTLED